MPARPAGDVGDMGDMGDGQFIIIISDDSDVRCEGAPT